MTRELLTRFGKGAYGWIFVLIDPIVHISFLAVLFGLIIGRQLPGADFVYFVTIGIYCWELTTAPASRSLTAVSANAGLFAYRQVRPATIILARSVIEISLLTISVLLVFCGFYLAGHEIILAQPARALLIIPLLALTGLGLALFFGTMVTIMPLLEKVFSFAMRPLYFASGIFYSASVIPADYRPIMLLNPVMVGSEQIRAALFGNYDPAGASLLYLAGFAFVSIGLGLAANALYGKRAAEAA